MTTKFNMTRDINGYNGFGLQPCDTKVGMTLVANTPQSVTVPSDSAAYICVFMIEPGDAIWIAHNTTATIPSGSAATCNCELNPPAWRVLAGDTLSFNTTDASDTVGVKFYSLAFN